MPASSFQLAMLGFWRLLEAPGMPLPGIDRIWAGRLFSHLHERAAPAAAAAAVLLQQQQAAAAHVAAARRQAPPQAPAEL